MHHEDPCGLPALDARVARDLDRLAYPDKRWVLDLDAQQLADIAPDVKPEQVLNCAVIGGGQFGLTIAHGLQRECVNRVQVFDRNPRGLEGPWMTFARMQTLRTPKRHTGHELGNASLGFQAWYEAQHGSEGWERLFRISRQDWQAYLVWYREVTGVDVVNDGEVTAVEPWPDADRCVLFRLTIEKSGQQSRAWARTVVFASGSEGSGGQQIPDFISDHLPKRLYAHTSEWPIDFSALAGKRIGLLGSGASAFDAAIKALEAGASQAVLCFRRPALPLDNPRRWMEFSGFLAHYPELSDAERWRYAQHVSSVGQPPPLPTFERAIAQPGFVMMPGTPWLSVREDDGRVVVSTPHGEERFDFVFAATGSLVDLKARPEFAGMLPHVALWSDRYQPPAELENSRLMRFPYLGRHAQFTARQPGATPWVERVFTITRGATLSMGPSAASNSNIKYTAPRIIAGVTRALFLDDAPGYAQHFAMHDHAEAGYGNAATTA